MRALQVFDLLFKVNRWWRLWRFEWVSQNVSGGIELQGSSKLRTMTFPTRRCRFFLGILIYCIRNSFFAPKPSGIKSDCYTLIRNYVGSRKEPSDSSKGKIINQDKKIANLDFFTLIKRILVIKSEICTLKLYATGVYFLLYFSRFGSQQLPPD